MAFRKGSRPPRRQALRGEAQKKKARSRAPWWLRSGGSSLAYWNPAPFGAAGQGIGGGAPAYGGAPTYAPPQVVGGPSGGGFTPSLAPAGPVLDAGGAGGYWQTRLNTVER